MTVERQTEVTTLKGSRFIFAWLVGRHFYSNKSVQAKLKDSLTKKLRNTYPVELKLLQNMLYYKLQEMAT